MGEELVVVGRNLLVFAPGGLAGDWSLTPSQPVHDHKLLSHHRLVGLVVRRPPPDRKIPGSNPACAGIFSGSSHTSDLKIGIPVATCKAPGVIGSALGLVGPVSVYCDWVR